MTYKRNKNPLFRILLSNASILILGVITVWFGVSTAKELHRKYQLRQEINQLKQEINALDKRNRDFASLIDSFQDSKVIEREAKRRLNLKKPEEEVAVILRDKNDESQNIVQVDSDAKEDGSPVIRPGEGLNDHSNSIKWWQYITDNK